MTNPLPPLNAVRVFETAARHLNFARAAEELGVTGSAVSKQVAMLEDHIGGQLFERKTSGLALTLEGRELKHSLEPAFEILFASFKRYSRRPPRSNKFRLATVASFASEFLVPRLKNFEERFTGVELEILTSDRLLDLSREEVDLSIRYGAGDWQGVVSHKLSTGLLLPVCNSLPSPSHRAGEEKGKELRRIQIFSTNEWQQWDSLDRDDIQFSRAPIVMEHFLVALRAAMNGTGMALLPELIVNDRIACGDLVQFGEGVAWPQAFHLVHIPRARRIEQIKNVMDWILEEAASSADRARSVRTSLAD